MGICSSQEKYKIKYIPGYGEETYGAENVRGIYKRRTFKFRQWGITLKMVDEFVAECGGRSKLEGLTTREVNRLFVKPLTSNKHKSGEKGASYCSWKRSELHPGISDADCYVCHAWDVYFLEFIDSLKFHIGEDEYAKTRLWIDLFCINQHRDTKDHVKQHRWHYLSETLKKSIESFDRFIVFFEDWSDPVVFQRSWSLIELYYGIECGLSLEVVLPRGDIKPFREAIIETDPTKIPYNMFRMLGKIDVRSAKCRYQYQHKLIIRAILSEESRTNLTPVMNMNEVLMKFFKNWVIREASYCILDAKYNADPLAEVRAKESLANIFRYDGRPDVASEVYIDAVRYHHQSDPEALNAETIHSMYLLANSYSLARQSAKAAKWYERALQRQLAPLTAVHNDHNFASPEDMVFIRKVLAHPDTLRTVKNLCGELYCCGEMDRLWACLDDVYDKYKMFLGTSFTVTHTDGTEVGGILRERLRYRGGRHLKPLRVGMEIDHNIGRPDEETWLPARIKSIDTDTNHPHVAIVGNIMGYIFYLEGEYDDAEMFIKDSLVMRQRYLGSESSETLITMRMHAKSQENLGNTRSADKYFERQFRAEMKRYRMNPPSVVARLQLHEAAYLYADFLSRNAGADAALAKFDLARYTFDAVEMLGYNHPDARKLHDLYLRLLERSSTKQKYLRALEFSAEYDKLRYKHRDKKLLLLADKLGPTTMTMNARNSIVKGSMKVPETPFSQLEKTDEDDSVDPLSIAVTEKMPVAAAA